VYYLVLLPFGLFLGELERTFLVLREVIAIRRLNERTGQNPDGQNADGVNALPEGAPVPGPSSNVRAEAPEFELPPRGTKRKDDATSTPAQTTSKRPHN
jgi:hypothetical protein